MVDLSPYTLSVPFIPVIFHIHRPVFIAAVDSEGLDATFGKGALAFPRSTIMTTVMITEVNTVISSLLNFYESIPLPLSAGAWQRGRIVGRCNRKH